MSARGGGAHAHAAAILRAAIAAADPAPLVARGVRSVAELAGHPRVRVLAVGKAAASMCSAALDTLDSLESRVTSALAIVPHDPAMLPSRSDVRVLVGAHPLPDASSEAAGQAVERLLTESTADDIVLVLLSGGASSLAVLPAAGLSVQEYADRVGSIMRAGVDIRTLNRVRRRIDRLKAGGMAALAEPARVIGLVLSDVVGDPLDIIASGPLTPDVEPAANVALRVIGNNHVALEGAAICAAHLGYEVRRVADPLTGEARRAGAWLAGAALRVQRGMRDNDRSVCLLAGGETTVTVIGNGRGGRNQELVLAAALTLGSTTGITVASAGTDGVDGTTDAAGAVADSGTLQRAATAGVNAVHALENNDSYSVFSAAGDSFITGPTGTNVLDVQLALIAPRTND